MKKRECAGCTACCTTNAIVELNKPTYKKCKYECNKGCNIYESRPQSCRDFECLWLKGYGDEKGKPNKIGLFIEYRDSGYPLGKQFFAKEVYQGAAQTSGAIAYMQSIVLETGKPVFLLDKSMQGAIGVMK